ncbi:MAG TPA: hypothetical protein VN442_06570 [Bryobacteraceae bacterium]|nr:hypothetical protein [Bryobacteraceae bacterium]
MKAFSAVLALTCGLLPGLQASPNLDRARQMEQSGDSSGARTFLARAAQSSPEDVTALTEYAEFLDRYGDPEARDAYAKVLNLLRKSGDQKRRVAVARHLTALDLLAGDRAAAERHLEEYRAAGGKQLALPPVAAGDSPARELVSIPGPLRSFARMAAISSETAPEDVLPALARNVVTNGYQASNSNDALDQTEYLKLVHRYLSQAREMEKLAGPGKVIEIESCESPKAGELLRILGYRMRGGCGSEVVLETVNATRAFLTADSGFPLHDLEQAMRTNRPFRHDFQPTRVPVMFTAAYWLPVKEKESDFLDVFLSDPALCRLYLGFSKLDPETAEALRKHVPMQRLKAYAHVLDFFGGMFELRNGKMVVPGGQKAVAAWAELAGTSPDNGIVFLEKMLARDDGWTASYFDALARTRGPVLDYLTEPARLKRFYGAMRGKVTSPGPARPVFRSNADLMLLTTRLQVGPDGRPHIPGGVDVWKNLFINHPHGKYDGKLTRAAAAWKEPDDVVEALFALCRKAVENEPLKIFMTLSDLDRNRAKPLETATVDRLARAYKQMGQQYAIFNDADLSDSSIVQFLDSAEAVSKIRDQMLRANTAGIMQALVGLWRVFAREGTIPPDKADAVFAKLIAPYGGMRENRDLFDAGRNGVRLLLEATGSKPDAAPQDRLVDLLAGNVSQPDEDAHTLMVQDTLRILEAQRIVSLNALFELADHLDAVAGGQKLSPSLVNRLTARISEIQLPRNALSGAERNALAFGYWTERHIEGQRKMNLRVAIERASTGADKEKLREIRGMLAPVLRDTLVAYNYAHYAPPGAQILFTNPLFVRSHDFLGIQGANQTWRTTELFGTGWPSNGGGRLVGSLAGLPYALAEAEQNFLVPGQTQALIWGDLVPQMILSAKIPRWWKVTPSQMHWVALHMRYTQAVLAEAAFDPELRRQVTALLSGQASPARTFLVAALLERGEAKQAVENITPSELFMLGREMAANEKGEPVPCLAELRRLAAEVPREANYRAVSRAFGTPKPTLANSYQPELLGLRTFPTLMGYSSRIMAESWESNALYWAELADALHVRPAQLNVRIPEWTRKLVEQIFASHLEDWPALLRSLRNVGEDVRSSSRSRGSEQKASLQ